jgi:hypothetical protein
MPYLVEIFDENKRMDSHLFEEKKYAEDRYFHAFAAVSQNSLVRTEDGRLVRLTNCYLYEVSTNDKSVAKEMVSENEARRLQSSDDPMCGERIVIEGLFKVLH